MSTTDYVDTSTWNTTTTTATWVANYTYDKYNWAEWEDWLRGWNYEFEMSLLGEIEKRLARAQG